MNLPWACPVCGDALTLVDGGARWTCPAGHSFDVARQGYVNLLIGGRRKGREPGDNREMVDARHRFLSTGAFDRMTAVVADATARAAFGALERRGGPVVVLDVGCGEGRHTRGVAAAMEAPTIVAGVDVSRWAVALAARAHPAGRYAVANATSLPVADAAIDVMLSVFGPVFAEELARAVRPGGTVVAAHPGPAHLAELRRLVYERSEPHQVKPPLRGALEWFTPTGTTTVMFPIAVADVGDLWAMTPYRWHAPADIDRRLGAAGRPFAATVDVVVTTYERRSRP